MLTFFDGLQRDGNVIDARLVATSSFFGENQNEIHFFFRKILKIKFLAFLKKLVKEWGKKTKWLQASKKHHMNATHLISSIDHATHDQYCIFLYFI